MAKLKTMDVSGPNSTTTAPIKSTKFDEMDPKAMKVEEDMQAYQAELAKKKYRVKTTESTFKHFIANFYNEVQWEGYECYAISETHKEFDKIASKLKPSKTGKVSFTIKPEILEATFHFVKKHNGSGIESANAHRLICEDFSVTMAELNQDRTKLRDFAMEAEAAKHGITVEDYKKAADALHAEKATAQNQPNLR
jgi:hypothetical protein